MHCLFCHSEGPFANEHVIPASLGNDDLILVNEVCARCNNHFSHKVEAPVLAKSPLAFWRVFLGIKTRRGRLPSIDLSQPSSQKGKLPSVHPAHDDGIGFTAHGDGSTSVEIDASEIIRQIALGERTRFQFVYTPKILFDLGRFLCKIGIELLCSSDPARARIEPFERARRFARYGENDGLWPIFHFSEGTIGDLKRIARDADGLLEEIDCYSYTLLEAPPDFVLCRLGVGTDHWLVCLNDPYPSPEIRKAFPNRDLKLIWYAPDEAAKSTGTANADKERSCARQDGSPGSRFRPPETT